MARHARRLAPLVMARALALVIAVATACIPSRFIIARATPATAAVVVFALVTRRLFVVVWLNKIKHDYGLTDQS